MAFEDRVSEWPIGGDEGPRVPVRLQRGWHHDRVVQLRRGGQFLPPAYGVWKSTGPRTFETRYVFYTTRAPEPGDGPATGTDWWPAGHGVLTETITLSDDGQTYTSAIKLATFDRAGMPVAGDGKGTGAGTRIVF